MRKPLKHIPNAKRPAKYGRFIEEGNAYLVTATETPRPWCNLLGNTLGDGLFGGLFGQCGQGFLWNIGFRHDQITNWAEYQFTPGKLGRGRLVFLKDLDTGKYWTGNPQPGETDYRDFSCVHRPGVSEIRAARHGIGFTMRAFVPRDAEVEIWTLTLRNLGAKRRRLAVVPAVEFPTRRIHWHFSAKFHADLQAVLFHDNNTTRPSGAFLALDRPVRASDSSWAAFYGAAGPTGDRLHPRALERGLSNSEALNEWCVGALETRLTLPPGGEVSFNVFCGRAVEKKDAKRLLARFRKKDAVAKALPKVLDWWRKLRSRVRTELPDETLQYALNCWAPYCVDVSMRYRQQAGVGIRDIFQYCRGYLPLNPRVCREKILETLPYQYAAGHSIRMYDPYAGKLQMRDARDNMTWLADTLCAYLKETDDWSILDEVVPYFDKGKGTVWEHTVRAAEFLSTHLGRHKQVLVAEGDWNDGLRISGPHNKGESVWLTIAVCRMLRFTAEMARRLGRTALARKFEKRRLVLAGYVNKYAWDGNWYVYGYTEKGTPVGSKKSKEGKIFANVQTWALMEGLVPKERERKVWKAVEDYLLTDCGLLVQHPAYTKYDPEIGPASAMAPGAHENAGAYAHGTTFYVAALAANGLGRRAVEAWHLVHPTNKLNPHSGCEPFGSTTFYTGPASPRFGFSEHSWFTGSAAWMFFQPLEFILGIRPEFDGLRIEPAIPPKWRGYKVVRRFRGATYEIEVRNPRRVGSGVREVKLDGKPLPGNIVPPAEGGTHRVEVLMG